MQKASKNQHQTDNLTKHQQNLQSEVNQIENKQNIAYGQKLQNLSDDSMENQLNSLSEDSQSQSQVSFEQEICSQHNCFLYELIKKSTFFECFCYSNYPTSTFKIQEFNTYLSHLFRSEQMQNLAQVLDIFTKNLEIHPNFSSFLRHIYYTYPIRMINAIVPIMIKVWSLYLPHLQQMLATDNVLRVAKNISQFLCQKQFQVNHLKKKLTCKDEDQIHKIIEIMTTTVILVLQNIVSNPYLQKKGKYDYVLKGNILTEIQEKPFCDTLRKMVKRQPPKQ